MIESKHQQSVIEVMIGSEAKPILEAIKAERALHWKEASRDGIIILQLYAQ